MREGGGGGGGGRSRAESADSFDCRTSVSPEKGFKKFKSLEMGPRMPNPANAAVPVGLCEVKLGLSIDV